MSDLKARLLKQAENLEKAAEGESQRAKIILFATQIDEALKELLIKFLKPRRAKRETEDELLGKFKPLSSFNARIALAYRVGLMSKDDAEAFDILRDIRNDCAHKIFEFSLSKSPHSDHLKRFTSLTTQDPSRATFIAEPGCPTSEEEWFIRCCFVHLFYLHETMDRFTQCPDVFTTDLLRTKPQSDEGA
jgi:hypothetical protein